MKLLMPRNARRTEASQHAQKTAKKIGLQASYLIPRASVDLGSTLGQGAFGTVYLAQHSVDGDARQCVAKQINPKRLQPADKPLLDSEMKIWSQVDHPSCVKFLGACIGTDEYLLMCEYMAGGSLLQRHQQLLRRKASPLTEAELLSQLTQVASGMAYLHQRHVIHRDLKSANLLIDGTGRLAVSDFGLARVSQAAQACLTAETGSYRWMAPEVRSRGDEPKYGRGCSLPFSLSHLPSLAGDAARAVRHLR